MREIPNKRMPKVLSKTDSDAIAKARDDSNELGELKRVVNSLLQNVDAMSGDSLLLAATNHENLLDSAVWRRFDYKLEIELPDSEAIMKMIKMFANGADNLNDKEVQVLAASFKGLSGANVEEIVKKALRNSVIHGKSFTKSSIYEELFIFQKILPQNCDNERTHQRIKAKYLRGRDEKDYISLTDMLKAKDGAFFIADWLRNRNTVEFLGVWEQIHNPNFNYGEFAIIRSQAGLNSYKSALKNGFKKQMRLGLKQRQEDMGELMPIKI